ncbi:MAG: cytochrome c [Saprospiraceae bacterium]|nr:cytochrome c [Saprospiraceae bacterium]
MKWINFIFLILLLTACGCQQNPYQQGERLYSLHCANCHMADGKGLMSLYPPLNTPEFQDYADQFSCIIRQGLSDTITVVQKEFIFPMPAIPELNNVEISNIYNYIRHTWQPHLAPKTAIQVQSELDNCTK